MSLLNEAKMPSLKDKIDAEAKLAEKKVKVETKKVSKKK